MSDLGLDSMLLNGWNDLHRQDLLWQIGAVAVCTLTSWLLARWLRSRISSRSNLYAESASARGRASTAERVRFGAAGIDEILFPTMNWLLLLTAGRILAAWHDPIHVVRIAAVLMFSAAVIRLAFYAARRIFKPSGLLAACERLFQFAVWGVFALHVTGLLPEMIAALDDVAIPFGKTQISLWQIFTAAFWVMVTLIAALWAGATLEARLMEAPTLDSSLRLVFSRVGRAILILIAILISLDLVGIPLGVLSVFGGALGVGIGLGLQRIASNYASGFIILLDRSLRLGDLISVDKYYGTITHIRTRYTVVRAIDGIEAIIPNELLVSQAVQNYSYSDKRINLTSKIQIAYDSDVEHAMRLMIAAAASHERVLATPAPSVNLVNFGADGLDLELNFSVVDPEAGTGPLRSKINLAILRSFRDAGIDIPYPQRDVRVRLEQQPPVELKQVLENTAQKPAIPL